MKPSFSLKWLFVALFVLGIALTAALNANPWWNEATRAALIFSVFCATIIGWLHHKPALLCYSLAVVLCILFDTVAGLWNVYDTGGPLLYDPLSRMALLFYEKDTEAYNSLFVQLTYQRLFALGFAGGCIGWWLAKRKRLRDEGPAK